MKSPKCPCPEAEQQAVDSARRVVVAAMPWLWLGVSACADAAGDACFDLEALPSNQKRLRRSLGFRLAAADEQKRCGNCAFFTPDVGDCGKCAMLSGGTTSNAYVCESWAAKS